MSDTPRLEAFIDDCEARHLSIWTALDEIRHFARDLERELNAAKKDAEEGWETFYALRARVGADKYPTLVNEVMTIEHNIKKEHK